MHGSPKGRTQRNHNMYRLYNVLYWLYIGKQIQHELLRNIHVYEGAKLPSVCFISNTKHTLAHDPRPLPIKYKKSCIIIQCGIFSITHILNRGNLP